MNKSRLTRNIDDLLEKYQFHKSGELWNRRCASFVDVIDLQIAKSKDNFTINIGVAEEFVFSTCWSSDSSAIVDEQSCTVRARLGMLLCGRDMWWPLSDSNSIGEALAGIEKAAIPFLALNHNVDQMIKFLEGNSSSRHYPPESIYLALLYCRKNEVERCLEMLKTLETKFTGAWRQKVSQILSSLNSGAD